MIEPRVFVHLHDPESGEDIFIDVERIVAILKWKDVHTALRIKDDDVYVLAAEPPVEVMKRMSDAFTHAAVNR